MNSDQIREKFVHYFERQGHLSLPSASLVVQGDPSVLLTSAGMQQFTAYYLDPSLAPSRRVVTIQRCMRTSDIEEVGDDTHHSFFEMLGNFAFGRLQDGGYFKKEAIAFAYEVVTREYGLPAGRIWATTWAGEPGVPADEEAVALWKAVGVPASRIEPLNKKPDGSRENFWGPTGDSGPCGPCSEIHVDVLGRCPLGAADEQCSPGHNCGRFVEVWNLVFNQFFQEKDKSLHPLQHTGIDTGSGLERVVAVLQDAKSVYETDLLRPIVSEAERLLDAPYGEDADVTRGLRVIVDHARAVTFMVADGVFPSNEERGYVARRILRRAVRYGRQLGRREPFLARLAQTTVERYAPYYPHLRERQATIEQIITQEETRFSETLSAGTELLQRELDRLQQQGQLRLEGSVAFRLYDTFGFPVELTQEAAAARDVEVDVEGFHAYLQKRREESRGRGKFRGAEAIDLPAIQVQFEGYYHLALDGARVAYLRQGDERVPTAGITESDDEVWVVLDSTPFYAERGGQVGDSGWIVGPTGRMQVRTTQAPVGDVIVHLGRIVEGHLAEGDSVRAEVLESARRATMRHHTATHLLHAALREELGSHVHQAGSLVAPDRLRFDFSHGQSLSADQRRDIQRRVNEAILRNLDVRTDVLPLEEALRSGAVALFDEKYGQTARVVTIDPVSKELCGGTHVARTGDLGLFVLTSESSIGSGLRRVEALAGGAAEEYVVRQLETLDEVARALGVVREEAPARAAALMADLAEQRRRLETAERKASQQGVEGLLVSAEEVRTPEVAFKLLAAQLDPAIAPSMERLRETADWLRDKLAPAVLILGSVVAGRAQLLTVVSPPLVGAGLHAGRLLKEVAGAMGGNGGGRPELAQGGGGDPARLAEALQHGREAALAQASRAGAP